MRWNSILEELRLLVSTTFAQTRTCRVTFNITRKAVAASGRSYSVQDYIDMSCSRCPSETNEMLPIQRRVWPEAGKISHITTHFCRQPFQGSAIYAVGIAIVCMFQ